MSAASPSGPPERRLPRQTFSGNPNLRRELVPEPSNFEVAFVIFGVLTYCGAISVLSRAVNDVATNDVDFTNPTTQGLVLIGALVMVRMRWSTMLPAVVMALPFAIPLAISLASWGWSVEPDRTWRRSISLGTVILFAIYAQSTFGLRRMVRILLFCLLGCGIVSLLLAPVFPAFAYDPEFENALRGIYGQKNTLGQAMMVGALMQSFLMLQRGRLVWNDLLVMTILFAALFASQSATSITLTSLVVVITVLLMQYRRSRIWAAASMIAALGIMLGVLFLVTSVDVSQLLDAAGKDSTLTGRVDIWAGAMLAVEQRPWLGYGYSAFWLPGEPQVELIWSMLGWAPNAAHNGYIDVILQLGYVGLASAGLALLATVYRALRALFDADRRATALWGLLFIMVFGTLNYDESYLLVTDQNMLVWVMLTVALSSASSRAVVRRPVGPYVPPSRQFRPQAGE